MSNTDKGFTLGLEGKFFYALGNIAKKVAENSTETCFTILAYEPEIPQELLQEMKEED